jgi:F-type H+-transporting ATPase subunit c
MNDLIFSWAWLAIGLAWLWIAIWQGFLFYKAMDVIGKNPRSSGFFLTITILWIALVESAGIYGLIIAFQILSSSFIDPLTAIWVGSAIWLAWLWVGIWEWILVWSAIEAMNRDTENRNRILTYMILFLALVESAAIYGLIISFQLLTKLELSPYLAIWAWLSIWLTWLWVGIWEWILSWKSISLMSQKPNQKWYLLTSTILWIALVETAAIYWLIMSFSIIESDLIVPMSAIWAGLAVWLAWLWVWIGEWLLVSWSYESMLTHRANKSKVLTYMILFLALVESAAIYGLIIGLQILSNWSVEWLASIWAWLAIWLAWLWVGIWEWFMSSKSIRVVSKRPSLSMFFLTITILAIALVESAAIYWLIISMQILSTNEILWFAAVWAWLAIWFAWLWAWVGEWFLTWASFDSIARNPKVKQRILTYMILWVALVESAAIYGLIIAFTILS